MSIILSPEHFKQIVSCLEKGDTCYIHMETGKIIALPEKDTSLQAEEDLWQEERALINQDWANYLVVPPPSPKERLRWMQLFATGVKETNCRENLILVLQWKNAYHNYRKVLLDYPSIRKEWYQFRQKALLEWAQCVLNNISAKE